MYCINCGTELKEDQKFCTTCGKLVEQPARNSGVEPVPVIGKTTKWATPRLIIGIVTMCLFLLLQLQSCLASAGEALQSIIDENAGSTGIIAFTCSFFFLAAGIVSVACRKSRAGSITAGGIYLFSGLGMLSGDFTYFADLGIYCFLSFAFAVMMIVSGITQQIKG